MSNYIFLLIHLNYKNFLFYFCDHQASIWFSWLQMFKFD